MHLFRTTVITKDNLIFFISITITALHFVMHVLLSSVSIMAIQFPFFAKLPLYHVMKGKYQLDVTSSLVLMCIKH